MGKTFNMTGGSGGGGGGIELSSIAITTPPSKTAYQAGETFNPAGMVVTATYTNGATLAVGGYTYPQTPLTDGMTSVTITYTEGGISKTATQTITVTSFSATLTVKAPSSCTVTVAIGGTTMDTFTGTGAAKMVNTPSAGTYTITATRSDVTGSAVKTVTLSDGDDKAITLGYVYGFTVTKAESNPASRVTYTHDAVGKTPAYMDYANSAFNYGDWADVWFVADNKPLMLKSDGTVDYYLDPDDYTKKADGVTASDVANTSYDGNAMAQFPLAYFKRYEDTTYQYEIVADAQWSSDFKAYAHTDANGSIKDYFYWSLFGGSGSSSKIRSLKGQALAKSLTAAQEISGATANGVGWYTHTWSQHEYIRTLLVLIGKSTDTQAVFGNGNGHSGTEADLLTTGTLSDKGQFFGYFDTNKQVKVFHVEKFWGDQLDRTAGMISASGQLYYKMTPEAGGYQIDNVTGYVNSGVTISGTSGGYISATKCGEFGCIPYQLIGSQSTYECDSVWFSNSVAFGYQMEGGGVHNASGQLGAFTFITGNAPSAVYEIFGCGLSYI